MKHERRIDIRDVPAYINREWLLQRFGVPVGAPWKMWVDNLGMEWVVEWETPDGPRETHR